MINLKVLGAMLIAASALSSSAASAQAALSNPDMCEAEFASCTGLGTGSTPIPSYRHRQSMRRTAYRQPVAAGGTIGGWGNSYAMSGEKGWARELEYLRLSQRYRLPARHIFQGC